MMSTENTDSDTNRTRSIIRQVRDTFGSASRNRHHIETKHQPSSLMSMNNKHSSADNINESTKSNLKKSTPNSFTHHLSLLNQVKSHINKTRKASTTQSSLDNDNYTYISLPSTVSNSDSKSTYSFDLNQNSNINEIDSPSSEPFFDTIDQNVTNQVNVRHNSIDLINTDDDVLQQTDEINRPITFDRMPANKFKDPIIERNRPPLNKSPSLTSILTNTSFPSNSTEAIYLLDLCIERGKDLAIKDLNGTSDPYVKVFYGTEEKYITNIVYKNLNPIWNEKLSFFVSDLTTPVYFYIYDYDRIGRDESMGSSKVDLWKLPLEEISNATLDLKHEKRTDGKIGSIKMTINITQTTSDFRNEALRSLSKPSNRQSSLTGRLRAANLMTSTRRTIDIFIIEGRNLTAAGGVSKLCNPYVRLKFGTNKKYRTQTIKSTLNPKWHQSFIYDITMTELPPLELSIIDDTGGSGDYMGRGVCNLSHLDEERTHRISVDLEDNVGTIDLFITITGIAPVQESTNDAETSSTSSLDLVPSKITDEDIEYYNVFSTLRSIDSISDVGKVEIKIYQARDLSAKDINGKSDPFCVVELDSTRLRTHTIYKTLDPVWNRSFIIPVQDIHSVLDLTIYDEDMNKTTEFIGKISIPLLAIQNKERKWVGLKDRKCIIPVKGTLEIEVTLIYSNLKAIIRTFNPRQVRYYQQDGKFRVGVFKQHINRVRSSLKNVVSMVKFINDCFQWESPLISFCAFITSLVIVWNFELYMLPCALLLLFAWNAVVEYRRGTLGKPFATLGDETVSTVVQSMNVDEDVLDTDVNSKENKKSLLGVIHSIQDTVLEIQGYVDEAASTLERTKNVFNFTVPWLSILAVISLSIISVVLYYIPLRYLILGFIINKFTKRFRKPKGYIDNNELADFISRLPSDPELLQYREFKLLSRNTSPKKTKRLTNGK